MTALWAAGNGLIIAQVQPAIETSAYASGDLIGEKLTFSDVVKQYDRGGGGLVQSSVLVDQAAQEADIDLILFDTDPTGTTFTDNSALDVADADMDKIVGVVEFRTYYAFGDNSVGQSLNLALPFILSTGQDLYGALVSRGTPTYAAATDLIVRLNILTA